MPDWRILVPSEHAASRPVVELALARAGVEGAAVVTDDLAAAGHQARDGDRIAVAGSDRHAHAFVQRLGGRVLLAVLPLAEPAGLARYLGLGLDLSAACAALAKPDAIPGDLVTVGHPGGVATALNVVAVGGVDGGRIARRGRVLVDERAWDGVAAALWIGIGQFSGAANVAPKAILGDGRVEVVGVFGGRAVRAAVRRALPRGAHLGLPGVRRASAQRATVALGRLPVEIDGVAYPAGQLEIEVRPDAYALAASSPEDAGTAAAS